MFVRPVAQPSTTLCQSVLTLALAAALGCSAQGARDTAPDGPDGDAAMDLGSSDSAFGPEDARADGEHVDDGDDGGTGGDIESDVADPDVAESPVDTSGPQPEDAHTRDAAADSIDAAGSTVDLIVARARTAPLAGFTRATDTPFESVAAPGTLVNVWVSDGALDAFSAVRPELTGSLVRTPDDSLFVRTLISPDGGVIKHTVLWFPPGYRDVTDLYFVVATPDWEVVEIDGVRQSGALSGCQGCHLSRQDDGFLFGVPGR